MTKTKGIIFDFNGTLFFDNDKHVLAWGAISKLLRGRDITNEELHQKLNGTPNIHNVQYMMDGKATKEEESKYSLLKEEYYRDFCRKDKETFHLVEGVVEFFNELKENQVPFTIASASIKDNIDFFVESFHLDTWMKPSDIIYDDGTYENKIQMFQNAADVIGVRIEDTLIYEDSYSGIKNAYAAGCKNIVVICPNEKREEYLQFPGVIRTIEDFSQETL
ncbi:MAG: HAD family phosphatase [Anaerostipes sp.]|nr:HAD family phosphatase [Anaerostipes sp.]